MVNSHIQQASQVNSNKLQMSDSSVHSMCSKNTRSRERKEVRLVVGNFPALLLSLSFSGKLTGILVIH